MKTPEFLKKKQPIASPISTYLASLSDGPSASASTSYSLPASASVSMSESPSASPSQAPERARQPHKDQPRKDRVKCEYCGRYNYVTQLICNGCGAGLPYND